jgi:predicted Rossmann-fold nucleotide-binding protein
MRKFWFAYLAKAVVMFPGGFGTMDELFEILTLLQTRKIRKHMPVVLYGSEFWEKAINFDALVEFGTISPADVNIFHRSDTVEDSYRLSCAADRTRAGDSKLSKFSAAAVV